MTDTTIPNMVDLFTKIGERLDKSRCSTFKIMGYKYLKLVVRLEYHDCAEIVRYKYVNGGEWEQTSFEYSDDADENHEKWKKEMEEINSTKR